jgi:queuine/archaeosine tRNA-ribosyltransferase
MNYISKLAGWKCETANIPRVKNYSRIGSKMWTFLSECIRIPREYRNFRAQTEQTIRMAKTLHEPAAEKTSAASEKKTLSAHFVPERRSSRLNQFEVLLGEPTRGHD